MDGIDIAKKEFIERMVSEGGLNPKFMEHKSAYDKLADIVGSYVKLVGDKYTVTISPSELVKDGSVCQKVATAENNTVIYTEKRQNTYMSIDDNNILHETLDIKEQTSYSGTGTYNLDEYRRESAYNQEGLEMESTEKILYGGVSKHPKLSSYGDKTLFYDFTELLNNRAELSQHPITESVTMTKRNKDLVTAFVEREETTFTINGQIKEKDAGYIKLGDTRYSTLSGYANLIGKGEKLNEYNISNPVISLPKDPDDYKKEVKQLRKDYIEYNPEGAVAQAIMSQELEKKVGKEKLAEISKDCVTYMERAYQKLQDLQREREDNQMER